MRGAGLILLLLGVLAYLLPGYREYVPFRVPLSSLDAEPVGLTLGVLGLIIVFAFLRPQR